MALVNHIKREINAKIVYYGPEWSGKSTSLRYIYDRIKPELRGDLKTVPASGSSLLFFDFSPFEQPVFGGYRIRLHVYTLQGRVANPAAWKMTLKGADGLVVVADATSDGLPTARQSVTQLREFLGSYGLGFDDMPVVLQLNKNDLAGLLDGDSIARDAGLPECCTCLTNAVSGEGVLKTLTSLSRIVMRRIGERDELSRENGTSVSVASPGTISKAGAAVDVTVVPIDQIPMMDTGENLRVDEISYEQASKSRLPLVSIAESEVHMLDGVVRIPLEISSDGGVQRLVITVQVSPE